ncbi:peroxiredoxin [Candidatus Deianiraea vastatrix]|uniref:Alkyl hydroperoxide reductase C n=1 Tax=Candidatus Deianiraea vastatrix TaxID=2163644 RepID=A0A5B8XFG9_9RICK|nr:peroxiredoxin [Candidatus Deianiraea vastatrix]QED23675.1 Putative peroxiredoxin [Candidatus Deianiraea vastatrix]
MLTIGDKFPQFKLTAAVSLESMEKAFQDISNETYKGKWLCVFFWPKDFTFVCPTEIAEFGKLAKDFSDRDCQVLGASVDNEFVHLAWRRDNEALKDLPIPMLADVKRELSTSLGILDRDSGVSKRATFLVDPEGTIRYVEVTDMKVGRKPSEALRILDALQTDELCPCNWKAGEKTIQVK